MGQTFSGVFGLKDEDLSQVFESAGNAQKPYPCVSTYLQTSLFTRNTLLESLLYSLLWVTDSSINLILFPKSECSSGNTKKDTAEPAARVSSTEDYENIPEPRVSCSVSVYLTRSLYT